MKISKREWIVGGGLLLILLLAQQTLKFTDTVRFAGALQDAAHGPWAALVAGLIFFGVGNIPRLNQSPWHRLFWSFFLAGGFFFATELAQKFTDRDASLGDLILDCLGAAGMLVFLGAREFKPRPAWWRYTGVAVLFLLASVAPLWHTLGMVYTQRAIAPELIQFDSYFGFANVTVKGSMELREAPEAWVEYADRSVLQINVEDIRRSGISIADPQVPWRDSNLIEVDVFNPSAEVLPMCVALLRPGRVHGEYYKYQVCWDLQQGAQTVKAPLSAFVPEGDVPISLVAFVRVFTLREYAGRTFLLGSIRLIETEDTRAVLVH
ncbi:MAG: hypothetical protein AAF385_02040 [Pseudomonadota bacterium]